MMLKYEAEVRDYLNGLRVSRPNSKDDIRRLLLERKRENLIGLRGELKQQERRAIGLMRLVDYSNIAPRLVYVAPQDRPLWNWYRHILSSAPWNGRPGRQNYYFVVDGCSNGILGIVDVGSEVYTLGPRDKYIGWTAARKVEGALSHLANVGTCVCVTPFGLLTGGKFQLMATTADVVADMWQSRYGDILVGVVTTSLYGESSVYNRLKEFVYLGNTAGNGAFHITPSGLGLMRKFLSANGRKPIRGGLGGHYPGRQDILIQACSAMEYDFDQLTTYQPRGVYMALLGDGALEFLRGETPSFSRTRRKQEEIAEWWLERWYKMRWSKKRDEVASFDYSIYQVDSQVDLCGRGEIDSAADSNLQTGGASPAHPL